MGAAGRPLNRAMGVRSAKELAKGTRLRQVASRRPPSARSERLRLLARNRVVFFGRWRWTTSALLMTFISVLLTVVGLTFVASASSVSSLRSSGDSWVEFHQQLMFSVIGLVVFVIAAHIPYRLWWALGLPLLAVSGAVTLIAAVAGVRINGSRRWIRVGSQLVQPSEFVKFAAIAAFAVIFTHRSSLKLMATRAFLVRPLLPVAALAIGPILLQPDMGTASIVVFSCTAIAIVGGFPAKRVAQFTIGGAVLGLAYAMSAPYRRDRIGVFLSPESSPTGDGWHVTQSKLGFATGRLFGVGLGASRAKWGWVPNAHTDFIFAIIGEEVGLVGSTLILALFVVFGFVGFSVVNSAPDRFGALLAAGITAWVVSQAAVNIGTVLGLVPVTGVPLPFVSAGGSSFVVLALGIGVLTNIARAATVRDPLSSQTSTSRHEDSPRTSRRSRRAPRVEAANRRLANASGSN